MKYVLTGENDVVIHISDTLNYQSNGNVLVDNDTLAIAEYLVKNVYDNVEVPEEIKPNEYCYTKEQGFYKNKDYKRYYSTEERISALEDTVNMLLGF